MISRQWLIPFISDEPHADLLGVVLSWLTGECGTYTPTRLHDHPAIEFKLGEINRTTYLSGETGLGLGLRQRARELAGRAACRQAAPLLLRRRIAAGWDRPRAHRAPHATNGTEGTGDFEQVLSLLRLAPEHRAEALPLLADLTGEYVNALRYALGDASIRIGKTPWLWAAAARARSPWQDDARITKQHPGLGPDAGNAAQPAWTTRKSDRWVRLHIDVSPKVTKKPDERDF